MTKHIYIPLHTIMKEDTSRLFKKTYFQPETISHSMNIFKKNCLEKTFSTRSGSSGVWIFLFTLTTWKFFPIYISHFGLKNLRIETNCFRFNFVNTILTEKNVCLLEQNLHFVFFSPKFPNSGPRVTHKR